MSSHSSLFLPQPIVSPSDAPQVIMPEIAPTNYEPPREYSGEEDLWSNPDADPFPFGRPPAPVRYFPGS